MRFSSRTFLLSAVAISAFAILISWADTPKLPPPYATPSVRNSPKVIPRPDGATLAVPKGFTIEEFASGFNVPRMMILGPSKEILITDSIRDGAVYVLTNYGKDRKELVGKLDRPFGLAFYKDWLYIAETTSVKRYKYDAKAMSVGPGEEVVSLKDFGRGGHWTRCLQFDDKAGKFYVGIGSASNVSTGEDPLRAAISRYNADGTGHEFIAQGTRNPTSIHFYPGTTTLWAAVQERDELGDDLVPDYFTAIHPGGFYGWPYAYIGPNEDPRNKGQREDLVKKTIVPDLPLGAHVAVIDFLFYTGKQFPKEYEGGAFLAFHGSWNRADRVGQTVAFVPFKNGKPIGEIHEFLSGWMLGKDKKEVWGRPVGLMQLPDGSILLTDDGGKKVWRISYKG